MTKAGRGHAPIAAGNVGRSKAKGPGRRTRMTDVRPRVRGSIAQCDFRAPDTVNKARIGWRWLVWHGFSHKNRTQLSSRLQLHDLKGPVRGSGIFDSHRPLHSLG